MKSRFLVLFAIAAGAVVYFVGVRPRLAASTDLSERARAAGHPVVNVIVAHHAPGTTELVLPASLQALEEAPIYARTNGYLARYLVDLGDHVTAGQTLAIIEAPEVDQELNQARAALEQAAANLSLARISATRWKDLGEQHAVAQQEVDEKQAALAAREADVHAAQASVARLTELKQYQTIVAPFDGVISARNVDIGDLITAGSGGSALFRLAQTGTLRVYVSVPQAYFDAVKPGLPADVLIDERPHQVFAGKIVRVAGALDPATRTLRTEIQVPNEHGGLLAGMFGEVRLHLRPGQPPLLVPSNAVILRSEGTFLATVGANDAVHLAPVKLGRDYGTEVEIVDGLADGARVIANPRDSLTEGLIVEPIAPQATRKN